MQSSCSDEMEWFATEVTDDTFWQSGLCKSLGLGEFREHFTCFAVFPNIASEIISGLLETETLKTGH